MYPHPTSRSKNYGQHRGRYRLSRLMLVGSDSARSLENGVGDRRCCFCAATLARLGGGGGGGVPDVQDVAFCNGTTSPIVFFRLTDADADRTSRAVLLAGGGIPVGSECQ